MLIDDLSMLIISVSTWLVSVTTMAAMASPHSVEKGKTAVNLSARLKDCGSYDWNLCPQFLSDVYKCRSAAWFCYSALYKTSVGIPKSSYLH